MELHSRSLTQRGLRDSEHDLNERLAIECSLNPSKLPKAVWFIVPNEFGERFCFYGISPLLNGYFRDYLGLGVVAGIKLSHTFKFLAYLTPMAGAAISDLVLGKYKTIVYLSLIYIFGIIITSLFSVPHIFGMTSDIPLIYGPFAGLLLVAIGTGGIKPCVSSHGGDQFLESQTKELNRFYNYFYMAINAGSLIAGISTPLIVNQKCYSTEKSCYSLAFGLCALVMCMALGLFMIGKKFYRIAPPSFVFMPWVLLKVYCIAGWRYVRATKREREIAPSVLSFASRSVSKEIMDEAVDLSKFSMILMFVWLGTDQVTTTWQVQYAQMNQKLFGFIQVSDEQSSALNGILIIFLVPIFSNFVYPYFDRRGTFRLLDRMVVGMVLVILSTCMVGVIQHMIDSDTSMLIQSQTSNLYVCDLSNPSMCVSGLWQLIPYFLLTCGEVLFSISGINLAYLESGMLTKSSSAAMWLSTVAFGNLLGMILADFYPVIGPKWYMFLIAAIISLQLPVLVWIRNVYVYRADRPKNDGKKQDLAVTSAATVVDTSML